jgi:hypothetical protein
MVVELKAMQNKGKFNEAGARRLTQANTCGKVHAVSATDANGKCDVNHNDSRYTAYEARPARFMYMFAFWCFLPDMERVIKADARSMRVGGWDRNMICDKNWSRGNPKVDRFVIPL